MVWWALLPAMIRDVPFCRVTEEPALPQLMAVEPPPIWTLPSCTIRWPELAPVNFNNPVPVFRTDPAPAMLLPKVRSEGVTRLMNELVSAARENAGLVTVPKFTVTVAPLAAPREEPAPQVMPVAGRSVSYPNARTPWFTATVVPVPRMEAEPSTRVPVPSLVTAVLAIPVPASS